MSARPARYFASLAAVSAALLLVSCGSGSLGESVTGPSTVQAPGDPSAQLGLDDLDLTFLELGQGEVEWSPHDPDGVGANVQGKTLICHKGKHSLWVPPPAVNGHLRHGDTMGRCQVVCPCFSTSDIDGAASGCSNVNASCPSTFSLGLFCAPGGSGGTIGNIGYWEAVVGQNSCSWTLWDPLTGDAVTQTLPVDAAQFEACRAAITMSSYYPASCPQ